MAGTSTSGNFEYFFGDKRGNVYVNAFYEGEDFYHARNEKNANEIVGTLAWDIMTAKYSPQKDAVGMRDNDIDYEFTDLIVMTALLHKEIDAAQNASQGYQMPETELTRERAARGTAEREAGASQQRADMLHQANTDMVASLEAARGDKQRLEQEIKQAQEQQKKTQDELAKAQAEKQQLDADVKTNQNASAAEKQQKQTQLEASNRIIRVLLSDLERLSNQLRDAENQQRGYAGLSSGPGSAPLLSREPSEMGSGQYVPPGYTAPTGSATTGSATGVQGRYDLIGGIGINEGAAKELFDNVIKKWAQLPEKAKNFYNANLVILNKSAGKETPVDLASLSGMQISPSDISNYRINLKRLENPERETVFQHCIPKVPFRNNEVGKIWYSKKGGQKASFKPTDERVLRELYGQVYRGAGGRVTLQLADQAGGSRTQRGGVVPLDDLPTSVAEAKAVAPQLGMFTRYTDEMIRTRLLALKNAKEQDVDMPEEDVISMTDSNIWKRDAKGDLVKVLPDGKKVTYGDNDEATKLALTANNRCYTTLVNSKDEAECKTYVWNCLLNGDGNGLSACIDLLKSKKGSDFFSKAKAEISEMHPLVALQTLKQFGFKTHLVPDQQSGMALKKVECVKHWLANHAEKKFTDNAQKEVVTQNKDLLAYLDMIAHYVNANPAILNKNFKGESDEMVGNVQIADFAKALNIDPRKEPVQVDSGLYDLNRLRAYNMSGNMYTSTVMQARPAQMLSITAPGVPLTQYRSAMPSFQMGGNYGVSALVNKRYNQAAVAGSNMLNGLFAQLIASMKLHNKTLDDADRQKIENKIQNLKKLENDIQRDIKYIEEYIGLLNALRDYNSEAVSMANLKSMVEHKDGLSFKKNKEELNLTQILEALQKCISSDKTKTGGPYQPIRIE